MDEQTPDTDLIGGVENPPAGILQEGPAQTVALVGDVDCQPTKDDHGNRIGHVSPQLAGSAVHSDGTGRQGIVGDDPTIIADDEGTRGATGLIA